MHALRRLTFAKPIHTHTVHRPINRHFSSPKAIPQLSRRHIINIKTEINEEITNKASNMNDIAEEEEGQDSAPNYSRLLDSKLDSCPPQPFNERTNILWGAVYDTVRRGNDIESMSRWEQIQRGHIRKDSYSHSERLSNKENKESNYFEERVDLKHHTFFDAIIAVNDILQTHHSLDDIIKNEKPQNIKTLAKATGSLEKVLDAKNHKKEEKVIKMRNDLKWKKRQLKLHIKKKRRENLRMKKKTMQQRNQT